ncbi:VOC family protein [Rhizobium leguminosarum]|nr:VOC family protein [Rhizobium leguminosarum]
MSPTRAYGLEEAHLMLTIGSIVWGVRDVARAIEFWCAALNYKPLREPSEDWAILVPVTGEGQQMAITIVSSDPTTHQRHHLDLYASDQQAEVERLLSLGAQRVDWRYPEGADYIVLADPDGNTFCVIQKEMQSPGVSNPPV